MAIIKRSVTIPTLVGGSTGDAAIVGFGATYGRLLGMDVVNSATLGTGTDNAAKVKITDNAAATNASTVVYLDASDRDYTTKVKLRITQDDTVTGIGVTPVDTTGAAVASNQGTGLPIVKSPLEVRIINGGTVTDKFVVDVFIEK